VIIDNPINSGGGGGNLANSGKSSVHATTPQQLEQLLKIYIEALQNEIVESEKLKILSRECMSQIQNLQDANSTLSGDLICTNESVLKLKVEKKLLEKELNAEKKSNNRFESKIKETENPYNRKTPTFREYGTF